MSVHPEVAALLTIVSPELRGEEQVDWPAAEAALGTRLPSDYKSLLDTYGAGSIGELAILPPAPIGVRHYESLHIATSVSQVRTLWQEDGGAPGVLAEAEAVLPWGTGCNANEMAWLMVGPDPDTWPVVVWRRQFSSTAWILLDCGMVAFLNRLLRAEFDECPLGDESLWGRPMPFVSFREQRRRLIAGLHLITGEPDPYAAMFPIYD